MRLYTVRDTLGDPTPDRLGLFILVGDNGNGRRRSVEYRNRATPILIIPVDIDHGAWQQPVSLGPYLMRGTVIDPQHLRSTAYIDAERTPGERLLEDALTEIAGEEKAVGTPCAKRGEKPQFGDPDILRLVDNDEIKRRFAAANHVFGHPAEHVGPGKDAPLGETGTHPLENRPQDFALLAADPCFAAKAGDVSVILSSSQLPGIDNIGPLASQEARRETVSFNVGRGVTYQRVD